MDCQPTSGDGSAGPELSPEFQAQIRELARELPTLDFYALLGVSRRATDDEIRDGFFERSKVYHPDRHFGKAIGAYAGLLAEIYKRIMAAYEVLKDRELRRAYDRSLGAPRAAPGQSRRTLAPAAARGRSQRVLADLKRQLDLGRSRARRHFEEAQQALRAGDRERARALLRTATAIDPSERRYGAALGEVAVDLERERGPEGVSPGIEEKP
ncbi:MAG: DnaJ domain-containing protein [Myxococcota bacterium]